MNDVSGGGDRPWAGRRLHFVGIGGAGMSGIALVAHALGAEVSGSDRAESPYLRPLLERGVRFAVGHDAANVPAGAEVVYSTAIPPDNPERAAAGGRELHRADLLAELTALRETVAVAGTHGKTTTSAMIVHALRGAGLDPAFVLGGELPSAGGNAAWGTGPLVVEADESDRSLLKLHPDITVLTNVEFEHAETYDSLADIRETFAEFLARGERAVVWDRPEVMAVAARAGTLRGGRSERGSPSAGQPLEVVPYDAPAPVLGPGGPVFDWRGIEVRLKVPGAHNATNAAGALEACRLLGADPGQAVAALADFPGAARRFQHLGATPGGADVYDDYAHHPTEVRATLDAARTLGRPRLLVAFQPHLFSRTRALAQEFGAALALADVVVVLDVYPARERAEDFPGVSGVLVARAAADAAAGRPVAWLPRPADAARHLHATLRPGDLLIVMGAGDVDALGRTLVE